MAEQLDLATTPPPDPWQDVRAIAPGAVLVRVIDLARNIQYWIRFERTPANVERGVDLHDGHTYITPSVPRDRPGGEIGRPKEEHERIVAAADAAWSATEPA